MFGMYLFMCSGQLSIYHYYLAFTNDGTLLCTGTVLAPGSGVLEWSCEQERQNCSSEGVQIFSRGDRQKPRKLTSVIISEGNICYRDSKKSYGDCDGALALIRFMDREVLFEAKSLG